MTRVKLPKQWKHWCKKARIQPLESGRWSRDQYGYFYLHGCGRYWRVDCNAQLCVSDANRHFDRWANSEVTSAPMPKTEAEFLATVKELLHKSRLVDAARDQGDYDFRA